MSSRARRCASCKTYRPRIDWPSCRRDRLCDEIDVSLIDLVKGRTIEEYKEIGRAIDAAHFSARDRLAMRVSEDRSPDDFIAIVRETHAALFQGTIPSIAGRFRGPGEDVIVGGPAPQHQFAGAAPAQIEPGLRALRERMGALDDAPDDPQRFAWWAAEFLQRFFAIHPFRDGNGRTGRLLVEAAALATDRLVLAYPALSGPEKSAARRDYVYALQYAHKYAGVSPAAEHAERKLPPYRLLAAWLAKRVNVRSEIEIEAEAPPEWIKLQQMLNKLSPEQRANLGRAFNMVLEAIATAVAARKQLPPEDDGSESS